VFPNFQPFLDPRIFFHFAPFFSHLSLVIFQREDSPSTYVHTLPFSKNCSFLAFLPMASNKVLSLSFPLVVSLYPMRMSMSFSEFSLDPSLPIHFFARRARGRRFSFFRSPTDLFFRASPVSPPPRRSPVSDRASYFLFKTCFSSQRGETFPDRTCTTSSRVKEWICPPLQSIQSPRKCEELFFSLFYPGPPSVITRAAPFGSLFLRGFMPRLSSIF